MKVVTKVKKISENGKLKRRLASEEGCKIDLKEELPLFFSAFEEAIKKYEEEIALTPLDSRPRGYEAMILNAKMIQSIRKHFPNHCRFGKYKRFNLRINGYIVLFKKLNGRGMPMNIKTKTVAAISQQLSLPLFSDGSEAVEDPILYFGYRRDNVGEISDPKLVYIDDGMLKWEITEKDVETSKVAETSEPSKPARPTIKEGAKKRKTS